MESGCVQAFFETAFDVCYLSFAILTGLTLLRSAGGDRRVRLAGWMALLLGSGDAFHLIPRCYALWTTGLEANAALLGAGKLITSVTMTVFYLLLYYIWRLHNRVERKQWLTGIMWLLTALRIGLCLLPQNRWLDADPPLLYGIVRNIPFALMGLIVIACFAKRKAAARDLIFPQIPLAVALSFGFYIPVVLLSGTYPLVGLLMIPKTLAYVWVIVMCRRLCPGARLFSKQ